MDNFDEQELNEELSSGNSESYQKGHHPNSRSNLNPNP